MVLKRCVSLCSAPVLAGVLAAGSSAAEVPEICVECSGPIATYRCIVPDAAKVDDFRGRDRALGYLCVTEIAKSGGHEKCRVRRGASGQVCIGLERTRRAPMPLRPTQVPQRRWRNSCAAALEPLKGNSRKRAMRSRTLGRQSAAPSRKAGTACPPCSRSADPVSHLFPWGSTEAESLVDRTT
jgi:hypothetical protein